MANCGGGDGVVVIVDVGAKGGLQRKWKEIKHEAHLFEPVKESYDAIIKKPSRNYKIYNMALSDKKEDLIINVCKAKGCSSVYEHDLDYIAKYRFDATEWFKTEYQITVKADTLDSLNINADFIKIDVEGHAFPVLKGAKETLKNCIGLEIEIDFAPYRKGMSLFSDIHPFLVERGFELHEFNSFSKRDRIEGLSIDEVKDITGDDKWLHSVSGPIWAADCVWLKPPECIPDQKYNKAKNIYKVFNQEGYLRILKG